MIQIKINHRPINIGDPIPDKIDYLDIVTIRTFQRQIVPPHQVPLVKKWLNDVVDALDTDYILFNDILIPPSSLNKFSL